MKLPLRSMGAVATDLRSERILASPRWQDGKFVNLHPIPEGLRDPAVPMPGAAKFLFRDERRFPTRGLPSEDPRPTWAGRADTGLRVTWLGHSTVLLEIDGYRVITDPVWGRRASPSALVGPKRFQPVPVALHDMPAIDAVVISHDHYDHLDYPTIRALARTGVPFVTSLGVGAHLESWGIDPVRIHELDWWETWKAPNSGLTVTAGPSQHFSGRRLTNRDTTLWSSMTVRGPEHAVFFSGDTGLTDEYTVIRDRLGPFDLCMLEVGAWYPAWGDLHLGPVNALQAVAHLGNPPFLPVHWGTFALAVHPWDEPPEELLRRAPASGARLVMPRLGQPVEVAHVEEPEPWWRVAGRAPEPPSTDDRDPDGGREQVREEDPRDSGVLPPSLAWPD